MQLLVGKISGYFGIKGWVKVFSWCHPRENIFTYNPWYIKPASDSAKDNFRTIEITDFKTIQGGKVPIGKIQGIDSVEQAQTLLEYEIWINHSQLTLSDDDETFFWHELIGMKVYNQQNLYLGEITQLLETGAHDVLEVVQEQTSHHYLIPYIKDRFILSIDRNNKTLIVDWQDDWY